MNRGSNAATLSASGLELPSVPRLSPAAWGAALIETTKPRIGVMVCVTTLAGWLLAQNDLTLTLVSSTTGGSFAVLVEILTVLLGTALTAGGACSLNQFIEHRVDSSMLRTRNRPIPSGRLTPQDVLGFGLFSSVSGLFLLYFAVNPLTATLGALSHLGYLFVYTPLKSRTTLNTLVGAVTGAIPPVMGWTAVTGELGLEAGILFLILFAWQFPHFIAIAIIHKDDYATGGFKMLPVVESAFRLRVKLLLYTLALLAISLAPTLLGKAGSRYLIVAIFTGIGFFYQTVQAAWSLQASQARQLLLGSLVYLPVLYLALVLDKI